MSERPRQRDSVCVCVYIVFVAHEILVSVAHDDQVPRCHPAQDTLSCAKEREKEIEREKVERESNQSYLWQMRERWTEN